MFTNNSIILFKRNFVPLSSYNFISGIKTLLVATGLGFFILLFCTAAYGQEEIILRGEKKKDLIRIILEGPDEIIFNGKVQKRMDSVMVSFSSAAFITIKAKQVPAAYQVRGNIVYFHTGEYQQISPFFLRDPARLVIDVQSGLKGVRPDSLASIGIIIIDPGHGGYDTGLVMGEYKESEFVLELAKRIQSTLAKESAHVYLTREHNLFLPLEERARFSKKKRGHIFLSLHVGNKSELFLYVPVIARTEPDKVKKYLVNKGQEPFLEKSVQLSSAIKEAVNIKMQGLDVIIRPVPYTVLSLIEGAAIIIETPSFKEVEYTDEFIQNLDEAVKEGIYIYETQ